jgi:hypothetical protein
MLYNSTRETLLQEGSGYTALVADALYKAGFKSGMQFSTNDALIALKPFKTPPKVIRNGLYHNLFRRRGRRNMVFTMPEANEARKAVSASNLKIRDNLPDSAFKSLKAYRVALHCALIKRRPGKYTRGLLARRLGVSKQTTRNYDKECGHVVSPDYTILPLLASDIDSMPTCKIKGGTRRRWIAYDEVTGFMEKNAPPIKAIALQWLKQGKNVYLYEQSSNYYRPSILAEYVPDEFADFIQH